MAIFGRMKRDSIGTIVKHFFKGEETGEIAYDDKFVDTCEQKIILKGKFETMAPAVLQNSRKKSKKN